MKWFVVAVVLSVFCTTVWAGGFTSDWMTDQSFPSVLKQNPGNSFGPWVAIAAPRTNADRLAHATVYCPTNGKIYMIGGSPNGSTWVNFCQEYDPGTNTWTDKANMPTTRGWLKGLVVKGKIYVVGGYTGSGMVAVNEEFDPVANSWATKAPRPRALAAPAGVVWRDSLLYMLGGGDMGGDYAFVHVYNPATNTWATGTALPQNDRMGDAAIIGDTIYLAQAYNGSSCWANLYKGAINPANPTQITWTPGPAMSPPVYNGGMAAIGDNVYWVGGFENGSTVTANAKRYNRTTGTIVAYDTYPQRLARCCFMTAIPSQSELYVIAGDIDGNWNPPNNLYYKSSVLALEEYRELKIKSSLKMEGTKPNPTSGFTRVAFSIPNNGKAELKLYNAQGQFVKSLSQSNLSAGRHEVTVDTRSLSAGVYFVRLTFKDQSIAREITVVR